MTLKNIKHSLLMAAMAAFAWSCGGGGSSAIKTSDIAAPTGVTLEAVNSSTIKVTWTAVNGATGYVIYYSTTSGVSRTSASKKEVTSTATGQISDEITGLSTGTYYVVMAAKNTKGESKTPSAEVSVTLSESTTGVPLHPGATWTRSERGPVPSMWLDQGTPSDSGEPIGTRSINKGRMTFKLSNIEVNGYGEKWLIWLLADAAGGGETNFQLMIVSSEETRFIMQRFGDFTDCSPRGLAGGRWGCEDQDPHGELGFDPAKTYAFDCAWDGSADLKVATCTVSSTDGAQGPVNYIVGIGGGYGYMTEMGVGTISIYGYPTVPSVVTDFRLSIF